MFENVAQSIVHLLNIHNTRVDNIHTYLSCRVCSVEEELSAVKEEKERQLRQVRIKVEQSAQSLQHQHNIQEAKVHDVYH